MKRGKQPKIIIEPTQTDRILEGLAMAALAMLLLIPAAYYGDLPDSIPQHFNAAGEADRYGSKATVWVLPAVGLGLYTLLTLLNRWPHLFNYPLSITEENAETQYRLATRLFRVMKVVLLLIFGYICWRVVQGALSGEASLGIGFLFVTLGATFGTLGWYFWTAFRAK